MTSIVQIHKYTNVTFVFFLWLFYRVHLIKSGSAAFNPVVSC